MVVPAIASWSMSHLINSLRKCLRIGSLKVRIPCRRCPRSSVVGMLYPPSHVYIGNIDHPWEGIYQNIGISQAWQTSTEASKGRESNKRKSTTKQGHKNKQKTKENKANDPKFGARKRAEAQQGKRQNKPTQHEPALPTVEVRPCELAENG